MKFFVILLILFLQNLKAEEVRPGVYRTPDSRFLNLSEFNFTPNYKMIMGYRMHFLDEGPKNGKVLLLLHGEPTWSYSFRKLIPLLSKMGIRTITTDLIGFGRSDKPSDKSVHTYLFHVQSITQLIKTLKLKNISFYGFDWGGLIGLRVATENSQLFEKIIISNTGLPTGDEPLPKDFQLAINLWHQQIEKGEFKIGEMIAENTGQSNLAIPYNAPFVDDLHFTAGPKALPFLVPTNRLDPARLANLKAWEVLKKWNKPFLTIFSDSDPITSGNELKFQALIPGTKNIPHIIIKGAKHFLLEEHSEEVAKGIGNLILQPTY